MKSKIWGVVAVVALTLAGCAREVPLGLKAENLISRAAWTVKTFRASGEDTMKRFQGSLETAKAVAVFPALVKAGFIVGAEVGHGVLVARGADGSWGQPAFYTLGAGSVGLQIGGQVAETVLVIRSDDALKAVIEHQLKLGGDISVVGGTMGGGLEASTTANAGADVVVYSRAAGAFGGVSVEGGVMARRTDMNEAFYGAGATPESIILEGKFSSERTKALRDALGAK